MRDAAAAVRAGNSTICHAASAGARSVRMPACQGDGMLKRRSVVQLLVQLEGRAMHNIVGF